eukprot:Selendium_serpulae@DN11300_c0_g1_i1.p1
MVSIKPPTMPLAKKGSALEGLHLPYSKPFTSAPNAKARRFRRRKKDVESAAPADPNFAPLRGIHESIKFDEDFQYQQYDNNYGDGGRFYEAPKRGNAKNVIDWGTHGVDEYGFRDDAAALGARKIGDREAPPTIARKSGE